MLRLEFETLNHLRARVNELKKDIEIIKEQMKAAVRNTYLPVALKKQKKELRRLNNTDW